MWDRHTREHLPKDPEFQRMYQLLIECDSDETGRNATRVARILKEHQICDIYELKKASERMLFGIKGIGWLSYRVLCRAKDKLNAA